VSVVAGSLSIFVHISVYVLLYRVGLCVQSYSNRQILIRRLRSAVYGGCQRDTARICCRTPCCCAPLLRRPSLSIDISCPRGAQQQTRRTLLQRSIDGTDRQTDRQTDAHRTPHTTVQTVSTIGAAENVSSSAAKRRGLSTRLMRLLTPLPPSERGSRQKAEGSRRKCVRRFCAALEFRNRCSRMWGARDAA